MRLPFPHGPGASSLREAAKSSTHKTKSGQVRGWDPKVSRDYPLRRARSQEASPQLALRAHLHTLPPPQGKQGSQESQQCVPGGRHLVGSVPGSGRVPAAPLATLCNSWSSLQDRSHALGAAGQEVPFGEVVCPQHHLTSARRTKVQQKSLAGPVQAHVGYPS